MGTDRCTYDGTSLGESLCWRTVSYTWRSKNRRTHLLCGVLFQQGIKKMSIVILIVALAAVLDRSYFVAGVLAMVGVFMAMVQK